MKVSEDAVHYDDAAMPGSSDAREAVVGAASVWGMSSGPSGWLPIIITSLTSLTAGGSAGALITTYGGKGRERRRARSDVIAALSAAEVARLSRPPEAGPSANPAEIAELQTKCMLAGVPRALPDLYKLANDRWRDKPAPPIETSADAAPRVLRHVLAMRTIDEAASLLSGALWHPWLSRFAQPWRVRRLENIIEGVSGRRSEVLSTDALYEIWREYTVTTTWRDRVRNQVRRVLRHRSPMSRLRAEIKAVNNAATDVISGLDQPVETPESGAADWPS
jgi:hypothetical protein